MCERDVKSTRSFFCEEVCVSCCRWSAGHSLWLRSTQTAPRFRKREFVFASFLQSSALLQQPTTTSTMFGRVVILDSPSLESSSQISIRKQESNYILRSLEGRQRVVPSRPSLTLMCCHSGMERYLHEPEMLTVQTSNHGVPCSYTCCTVRRCVVL